MTRGGFFFRIMVGITHLTSEPADPSYARSSDYDPNPVRFTMAMGIKPW
jgi:hypothetical protein